MREEILIRQATLEDIKGIVDVEKAAWPDGLQASEAQLVARITTFPEGNFVGTIKGIVCGVMCTMIVDYDYKTKDYTWNEITDNGFIRNTHKPNGRYLYGIDLSVTPKFGNTTEGRISRGLIEAVANLIIEKDLEAALLGGRLPRFKDYADKMEVEQYVFGPWDLNGKKRHNPYDPELYFYIKNGLEAIRVIPNYMDDDPDSMNYGVLLRWRNPFHSNTSQKEAEVALSKITGIFSNIDEIFDPEEKCKITRWTLLLPGAGCEWYKKSGGCYMCGFNESNKRYTHGKLFPSWIFRLLYRLGYQNAVKKKPDVLYIYNGGSFISNNEIPVYVQEFICKEIGKDSKIKKLVIESRAEFVTADKISKLKSLLGEKELEIAIGLECKNDSVREKSVHKGMSLETYEKAVQIIKENSVRVSSYVLLKPLFLSESEAIKEVIETIKYAFSIGSDSVALESAFIQPKTIMEEYYNKGEFKPPYLWSVIEVIKQTRNLGPVYVGGFTDEPRPIAIPQNCNKCSPDIYKALDLYRETFDISYINNIKDCECKEEWKKEIGKI